MVMVDSNVLLDVITADPIWSAWSTEALPRSTRLFMPKSPSPLSGLKTSTTSYRPISITISPFPGRRHIWLPEPTLPIASVVVNAR